MILKLTLNLEFSFCNNLVRSFKICVVWVICTEFETTIRTVSSFEWFRHGAPS